MYGWLYYKQLYKVKIKCEAKGCLDYTNIKSDDNSKELLRHHANESIQLNLASDWIRTLAFKLVIESTKPTKHLELQCQSKLKCDLYKKRIFPVKIN